jgi:hypothetical protein
MARASHQLPDPPGSLDKKHAAELTAQTKVALERQRRELARSLERSFDHIPWPLRGTVRRVVGL